MESVNAGTYTATAAWQIGCFYRQSDCGTSQANARQTAHYATSVARFKLVCFRTDYFSKDEECKRMALNDCSGGMGRDPQEAADSGCKTYTGYSTFRHH